MTDLSVFYEHVSRTDLDPHTQYRRESVQIQTADIADEAVTPRKLNGYFAKTHHTADQTLNDTTWATVPGIADLVLPAAAGDLIEYSPQLYVGNQATAVSFDVVTIVSAAVVSRFGKGTALSFGVVGWRCPTSVEHGVTGPAYLELVPGDISGGNVTLRLRYRSDAAVNRTLATAAGDTYGQVFARNHGPTA